MRYHRVCLESLGYTLPTEAVTSEEIERRLEPLYRRLRLPEGRLELMTGIRERRFWPAGTRPSQVGVVSARAAMAAAGVAPEQIGALVHASVCRDQLEPATACDVHRRLGLGEDCLVYDVSNACLGFLNGVVQLANMIELGQIRAGLVVCTESGRDLVEATIDRLNFDESLTRAEMKLALASLTIGSASAAGIVVDQSLSQTGNKLLGGVARCATQHSDLCRGDHAHVGDRRGMLMQTDAEALLEAGIGVARAAFAEFLRETKWQADEIQHTFSHQVGVAHRRRMLDALGLDPSRDAVTVDFLGNTGSAALPVTMARAVEAGAVPQDSNVALLGIGSGINTLMLGAKWRKSRVRQGEFDSSATGASVIPRPHLEARQVAT